MCLRFLNFLVVLCITPQGRAFYIYSTGYAEEGADCVKLNGEEGTCLHYRDCLSAIQQVQANGRPEICSFSRTFDKRHPIVCCKNDAYLDYNDGYTNGQNNEEKTHYSVFNESSISLRKCREYHPAPKRYPSNGFIGGRDSLAKQYPHMALLGFGEKDKIKWQCGGSLISEKFVLTAAHCLSSRSLGKLKHVRLGELDLNSTTDDADPQDFTIKNTYAHPDYKISSRYHDIALVELDRPIRFSDYVKPACLAVTTNFTYTAPVGMGWGLLEYGGESANILQNGILAFVANEKCRKTYGMPKDLKDGIVDDWQICADGGGERRDTCNGDSGGPLQITNYFYQFNSFPEIVGITSFGKACALVAGVYTRVIHYVPWIEKIVWPNL